MPDGHQERGERWRGPPVELTAGLAVAQFIHCYGGATFCGSWATSDRVIPWGLFWELYRQIPHVQALDRLNESSAVALAIASTFGGKDGNARRLRDQEIRLAFPPARIVKPCRP